MRRSDIGAFVETLKSVKKMLVTDVCPNWADCVKLASRLFEGYFNYKIGDLIQQAPADAVTN